MRIIAFVLLIMVMTSFAASGPAAASLRYWATGADIGISLLDENGNPVPEIAYPANTPFYVAHGFSDYPWKEVAYAEKKAFMGHATYFELWIDGELQQSAMCARYIPAWDMQFKFFVAEYDLGMTDTHVFEGKWYVDGYLIGGTPGQAVLQWEWVSTVTFT
jgi:hypothetical protein